MVPVQEQQNVSGQQQGYPAHKKMMEHREAQQVTYAGEDVTDTGEAPLEPEAQPPSTGTLAVISSTM
jgi:hypothetical protein